MADPGRLDELKRKFEENPKRYFAPLANEYRKAGDPELAIELCRTYLPQQPTHMSGYIVYGQALHDAGHTDESAAVFRQALTLDPENLIALRNLGDMSRDAGDNVGAMRWYGKVLELDPRNEEIAAYITSVAHPGSRPPIPPADRNPPTVRPEPEPDASAVRLEDIFSEPDVAQMPFGADEPLAWGEEKSERPRLSDFMPDEAAAFAPTAEEIGASEPEEVSSTSSSPGNSEVRGESPFVTETMAELYMQQGLRGEALGIYRQLTLKRDDPRLRQRIAEIESVEHEHHAAGAGDGETVRTFFARIGAKRPNERVERAAERGSSLGALFGSAPANPSDLGAAQRLSGAFGNPGSSDSHS